ncbi:hypothetical protein CH373_02810 [Leptospira perolatii]|uniref:Tetratricopeptide repeat protein n=1 Tax=Leptospira perolatii TaxID=2023191 RepID=A0A2M9ZSM5_9LEPT|nr:hypothetical protein [Leptospira perolatii]PJZ71445.1 hypothetical protein CH360_02810 [Leptospira perolatii]PJZ74979.1 hypothetical protein CH373_02810 [Leptospira perolatii]
MRPFGVNFCAGIGSKITLVLILGFYLSCGELLIREDYHSSQLKWREPNPKAALAEFPSGERGSFITTLEKSTLRFFSGDMDFSDLKRQAERSKTKLRFTSNRDSKSFFYMESPEGYYASEAEIIYMHILLGLFYAKSSDLNSAKIEATYAGNLLNSEPNAEGQFDDATLRILLATLLTTCGNWNEAKAEFKAALKLSQKSSWLKQLSGSTNPPAELLVLFGGPGPEPYSSTGMNPNLITGLKNLSFEFFGKRTDLNWQDSTGRKGQLFLGPSTADWYQRRLIRDNAIQETLKDSRYFHKFLSSAKKEETIAGLKTASAIAIGSMISALGAGIAYISANTSNGKGILVGVVMIAYGIMFAVEGNEQGEAQAKKQSLNEIDISNNFRFARFLPEYLWVGDSQIFLEAPVAAVKKENLLVRFNPSFGKIPVRIGYFPDLYDFED